MQQVVPWKDFMKCQKRKALNPRCSIQALQENLELVKAKISAKVEHQFRMVKCQSALPKFAIEA